MRPVIGVSAYSTRAAWGAWDVDATLLPQRYVESIVKAGGLPIVLPALPGLLGDALDRLDGVVVSGGPDVDPARYGAEPGPDTQPPSRSRDAAEMEIVNGAVARGLPVLGICRGMQVLNVARGGTLVQHLPDVVGTDAHCPAPGRYGRHDVLIATDSLLAAVLDDGDDEAVDAIRRSVPTYHHQAIAEVGTRLVVTAWAEDGVIEAVEDSDLQFCVGVQWHPEAGDDLSLFTGLVAAARGRSRWARDDDPVAMIPWR